MEKFKLRWKKLLYNILLDDTLKCIQLVNGFVYIYNKEKLVASFSYFGRMNVNNLTIGKNAYSQQKTLINADNIKALLDQKFPDASNCVYSFKWAEEFSILETALADLAVTVEIDNCDKYGCDVYCMNSNPYLSCSFRYLYTGKLKKTYIRLHEDRNKFPTRVHLMRIPKYKLEPIRAMLKARGMKNCLFYEE